jgi:hypothetical protein
MEAGLMGAAEADRLTFVALAHHVLTYCPENVGGLFRQLLSTRRFAVITQANEEAAQQRLKRYWAETGWAPPRRATG